MNASERNAKELILAIIEDQPADSSYDEILRKLAFNRMVSRGLVDVGRNRVSSTSDLRTKVKQWSN